MTHLRTVQVVSEPEFRMIPSGGRAWGGGEAGGHRAATETKRVDCPEEGEKQVINCHHYLPWFLLLQPFFVSILLPLTPLTHLPTYQTTRAMWWLSWSVLAAEEHFDRVFEEFKTYGHWVQPPILSRVVWIKTHILLKSQSGFNFIMRWILNELQSV